MQSSEVLPGVLHVVMSSRKRMNVTMCRLSEFYESPDETIRGQKFGLDDFLEAYLSPEGRLDYFETVEGHNIPGRVVNEFFNRFYPNKYEAALRKEWDKDLAYLIVTDTESEESTVSHELAHAKFGTDENYKAEALRILGNIPTKMLAQLKSDLRANSVSDEVMLDELQAYLATAEEKELRRVFPKISTDLLAPYIRGLRALTGRSFDWEFENEGPGMLHC